MIPLKTKSALQSPWPMNLGEMPHQIQLMEKPETLFLKIQKTLNEYNKKQEWLGMENAYAALMQPAGFEWDGRQWSKNPGKIDHSVIEKAHNDGLLTDDQYNLIQLAAELITNDNRSNFEL